MFPDLFLQVCNNKQTAVLLKSADSLGKFFVTYRPNTGKGSRSSIKHLLKKYEKVGTEEARKWWVAQYESSLTVCTHAYW